MRSRTRLAIVLLALAGLAPLARAADTPPLIPLQAFVANPNAAWDHRISPELAYYRAVERFLARHLGGRDGGDIAETSTAAPGAR